MSVLTQGTEIFAMVPTVADPTIFEILRVACPTSFSPGDESSDDIDDTCLDETDTRSNIPGLITPGEASLEINTDPSTASHVRLFQLKKNREKLSWFIGWSDGKSQPAIDAEEDLGFTLPSDRTWLVFKGAIGTFPFAFETNSVVKSAMTIKRSGALEWVRKSTTP